MNDRLARAYAAIDAINAEDPATEQVEGAPQPKELLYGRRMTSWLERLEPAASDALRIAVRGQHVGRFRVPRDQHPAGRVGYLEWRKGLGRLHADSSAEAARAAGYEDEVVERVRFLVQKKALRSDVETQLLEDCACLVFLEHHFAELAARTEEAKMLEILRKTWGKMSERAHDEALRLPLGEAERSLVEKALS